MNTQPITVSEVKKLLKEKDLSYTVEQHDHDAMLTVRCPNGKTDLAILFTERNDEYVLDDMLFGNHYSFELFQISSDNLRNELRLILEEITEGKAKVIVGTKIKSGRWYCSLYFNMTEEYERKTFKRKMKHIESNSFFWKLYFKNLRFEVFDWNSYRCIEK